MEPQQVYTIENRRDRRDIFKNRYFMFRSGTRFCITLDITLSIKHLQHFFNVRAHNTKRDKMSLHTRVRLVIFGTLLSTTVVFNESVSTLFYLCICLEMHILNNHKKRIDECHGRIQTDTDLCF